MRHRSLPYITWYIKLTTFNVLSAFIRFVKSLTNFKHKAIALFAFAVLFVLSLSGLLSVIRQIDKEWF